MITEQPPPYQVRLARSNADLRAAYRLRYDVFVKELGGAGPLVDHEAQIEQDLFDPHSEHMIVEHTPSQQVVGVYRLMRSEHARSAGQFYSESEYDLSPLKTSGRTLLELGRSCLHPDFRGGMAMHCLWAGLSDYIADHQIDLLFGVASFHGTNMQDLAGCLSLLHHRHLAAEALRVRARDGAFHPMDLIPEDTLDRRAAMVQMPTLIKAYLRLGGTVGEGAYIDRVFNTTDVCLILDIHAMSPRQKSLYQGRAR